ncbi:MAG: hypothetical protein PHX62_09505 [Bacilli bacterium]|nr:hypothetical protein [Bacilli bacterium]
MDKKLKLKIFIGSLVFLLVGILAFVLGYGLTNGWAWVLGWFTSRWAIVFYLGLIIYLFGVSFVYFYSKIGGKK